MNINNKKNWWWNIDSPFWLCLCRRRRRLRVRWGLWSCTRRCPRPPSQNEFELEWKRNQKITSFFFRFLTQAISGSLLLVTSVDCQQRTFRMFLFWARISGLATWRWEKCLVTFVSQDSQFVFTLFDTNFNLIRL